MDNEIDEPFLILPGTNNITLFGFTEMSPTNTNLSIAGSKVKAPCSCLPEKSRQWIFRNCGIFLHHLKTDTLSLMCQCGIGKNLQLKCVKHQDAFADEIFRVLNDFLEMFSNTDENSSVVEEILVSEDQILEDPIKNQL